MKPSPEGVPGAVTDPTRVAAEELTFAGADGDQVNGYLARPAEPDPAAHPAMIVIHEADGTERAHPRRANRFANLGYVALGVDLYTREGGPPADGRPEAMMKRLFGMSDARVLGDLEGAADLLRSREDVTGKVGCIGFCMGGRYTLLFAARATAWRRRRLLGRVHRQSHTRGALDPGAPHAAARARGEAQLPPAGRRRRRRPQPLA